MKAPLFTILVLSFLISSVIGPLPTAAEEFKLPAPGVMVHLSPPFSPAILKGIKIHPDNPLRFEFILDKGDYENSNEELKSESTKLIKYFLSSLTISEKDLWVNLSPYEKERIAPEAFSQTVMGRDLLAEDYLLKQITASLVYPEDKVGKNFWNKIYLEAEKKFGTKNIPVNTFNKVWIVPEKAIVFENAALGTAYVVESKLKVMLEQDYLASKQNTISHESDINRLSLQIIKEIIIPELEKEVNENKNFTQLRQIYNSLILATWYKKKIEGSILDKVYLNRNKVQGVNIDNLGEKQKIYNKYLQSFKKGAYSLIKDEYDAKTKQILPRKYFSGGMGLENINEILGVVKEIPKDSAMLQDNAKNLRVVADLAMSSPSSDDNSLIKTYNKLLKALIGIEWEKVPEVTKQIFRKIGITPKVIQLAVKSEKRAWSIFVYGLPAFVDYIHSEGDLELIGNYMNAILVAAGGAQSFRREGIPNFRRSAEILMSNSSSLFFNTIQIATNIPKYQNEFIDSVITLKKDLSNQQFDLVWNVIPYLVDQYKERAYLVLEMVAKFGSFINNEEDVKKLAGELVKISRMSKCTEIIKILRPKITSFIDLEKYMDQISQIVPEGHSEDYLHPAVFLEFLPLVTSYIDNADDLRLIINFYIEFLKNTKSYNSWGGAYIKLVFVNVMGNVLKLVKSKSDLKELFSVLMDEMGKPRAYSYGQNIPDLAFDRIIPEMMDMMDDFQTLRKLLILLQGFFIGPRDNNAMAIDKLAIDMSTTLKESKVKFGIEYFKSHWEEWFEDFGKYKISFNSRLNLRELLTEEQYETYWSQLRKVVIEKTISVDDLVKAFISLYRKLSGAEYNFPAYWTDILMLINEFPKDVEKITDAVLYAHSIYDYKQMKEKWSDIVQSIRKICKDKKDVYRRAIHSLDLGSSEDISQSLIDAYQINEGEVVRVNVTKFNGLILGATGSKFVDNFPLLNGKRLNANRGLKLSKEGPKILEFEISKIRGHIILRLIATYFDKNTAQEQIIKEDSVFRVTDKGIDYFTNDEQFFARIDMEEIYTNKNRASVDISNISFLLNDVGETLKLYLPSGLLSGVNLRIGKVKPDRVSCSIERINDEQFIYTFNAYRKTGTQEELYATSKFIWRKVSDGFVFEFQDIEIQNRKQKELVEKRNEEQLIKILDDFISQFKKEDLMLLVTRYGLDIKNIIWGMLGAQLEGKYDQEKMKKLIDNRLLSIIFKSTEEISPQFESVAQGVEELKPLVEFQSSVVDEDNIRTIAQHIEEGITPKGNNLTFINKEVRLQAVSFIRKMEEDYFFREYYQTHEGEDVVVRAKGAIEAAILKEPEGIFKEALQDILQDINHSLELITPLKLQMSDKVHFDLYQLIAVYYMVKDKKKLLADEMGLGKTLEAIMTFLASGKQEMLILGPNQVLSRWLDDIGEFTNTPLEVVIIGNSPLREKLEKNKQIRIVQFKDSQEAYPYLSSPETRSKESQQPQSDHRRRIILCNYELMYRFDEYRLANKLPAIKTDFIALDEVHFLKNPGSRRTKAIFGDNQGNGAIEAEYKILMSGTPLENEIGDLFGYLRYLAKGGDSEEEKFLSDVSKFNEVFSSSNISRLSLLHSFLSRVMIRRLKDNIIKDLPRKKFILASLNPSNKTMTLSDGEKFVLPGNFNSQLGLYEMALRQPLQFQEFFQPHTSDHDNKESIKGRRVSDPRLLRLEQIATDPTIFDEMDSIKFAGALELARQRIKQGKSVLVFTTYSTVALHFRLLLEKEFPDQVAYMDGDVEEKFRSEDVERFQNKQAKIFVATEGTGGVGRNLTQADTILFLNNPWKSSTFMQAIDRAHRRDTVRNYPGRELEIITFDLEIPISIDRLKAQLIQLKRMLSEMVINGNLTKEILEALEDLETTLIGKIDEAVFLTDVAPDAHEINFLRTFQELLEKALRSKSTEESLELWNKISSIYVMILQHKGSFFANMASIDYLTQFSELKANPANPKLVLDLGSGPSTFKRAYLRKGPELNKRGFYFHITDFDFSEEMLKAGIAGSQILGSFSAISSLPSNSYDLVNCSYAYRYAEHPADLMVNIQRILKPGGIFTLILPPTNLIPDGFISSLKRMGFEPKVLSGAKLQSDLDDQTYDALVKEYGTKFANDLRKQAKGEFTYLVVKKEASVDVRLSDFNDADFRVIREIAVNKDTVDELLVSQKEAKVKFVPLDSSISGKVVYEDPFVEKEDYAAEEQGPAKKVKRFGYKLSKLTIDIGNIIDLRHKSPDEKDKKKIQHLMKNVVDQMEEIKSILQEMETDSWSITIKQKFNNRIAAFITNKSVVQWFKDNNRDFLNTIKQYSQHVDNGTREDRTETGGIDLTLTDVKTESNDSGKKLNFIINESMLEKFENSKGFTPIIIEIEPMTKIKQFLGVDVLK